MKLHSDTVAHARFEVEVGAVDSYSLEEQAVSASHTESLVSLPTFE
jgi:hypothetical protein